MSSYPVSRIGGWTYPYVRGTGGRQGQDTTTHLSINFHVAMRYTRDPSSERPAISVLHREYSSTSIYSLYILVSHMELLVVVICIPTTTAVCRFLLDY